ncbi:MAG: glucose-6-phosphate dehydrogenase [Planctomycetes bacterium]|nr:glucose-6-phosphate dehydrogenase [Planctomycetota bacterium]MBI3843704.1 glucose-6-phosphate dehydrogenase [Planctomycetota bacterium]
MSPPNTRKDRGAAPCTLVIFGAAGDLTRRKLVPSLYNLRSNGLIPNEFAVVGVARKELSTESWRESLSKDIREFATGKVDDAQWAWLRDRIHYSPGNFDDPATYRRLGELLADVSKKQSTGSSVLFYLSTPPDSFAPIVKGLGAAGLTKDADGSFRRVIIEKPFGRDLDSARSLNNDIRSVLREDQIYRIDHYLGKETVQNIMVLRFANGLFEPVWNRRYVDHVQITVAESVGVEGRGNYYETAGVLRDMVQNHMLQLLALIAMEPPVSFEADAVRDEKVKVLHAIRPMSPEEILVRAVRGQYGKGLVGDKGAPGYRTETNVSPTSATETFAALQLFVENWRWAGVPFYLRSGKRLPRRRTEIMIRFRMPPQLLFRDTAVGEIEPNRLVLHIQPEEGISIHLKAKQPGPTIVLNTVRLDFDYKTFGEPAAATGYERLLYDAMIGDSTLFHRSDMVEAAWKIATPILDVWRSLPPRDFPNYAAGTWGPASADALIQRDGHHWWNGDDDNGGAK